jgi:hypothetical protein
LGKVGTSGEKPPAPCRPTPCSNGSPTGMKCDLRDFGHQDTLRENTGTS